VATVPTIAAFAQTTWTAQAGTPNTKVTASVSWQAGDVLVAFGGSEGFFTTRTVAISGGPGGWASWGDQNAPVGGAAPCAGYAWYAEPVSPGSGTVTFTCGETVSSAYGGAVWVLRDHGGRGNIASEATPTTARQLSLTRAGDNSIVLASLLDYQATAVQAWDPTITNERTRSQVGTSYTVYVGDWGDQGAAGSASYGIGATTGGVITKHIVEIKGLTSAAQDSGPNYAGAAADMGGGSGSWTNPTNAQGAADTTYAVWTSP
jgi:hypothetical protein